MAVPNTSFCGHVWVFLFIKGNVCKDSAIVYKILASIRLCRSIIYFILSFKTLPLSVAPYLIRDQGLTLFLHYGLTMCTMDRKALPKSGLGFFVYTYLSTYSFFCRSFQKCIVMSHQFVFIFSWAHVCPHPSTSQFTCFLSRQTSSKSWPYVFNLSFIIIFSFFLPLSFIFFWRGFNSPNLNMEQKWQTVNPLISWRYYYS